MPPSNTSGSANIGGVVPASWKTALDDKRRAEWVDSDRDDPRSRSKLIHDAVELYLAVLKAQGNLPDDAADDVSGIDTDDVLAKYGVATIATSEGAKESVEA